MKAYRWDGEKITIFLSRKSTIGYIMCVRPSAWNESAPTERISKRFDIFLEKSVGKFQVSLNLTRLTGALHEDRCF